MKWKLLDDLVVLIVHENCKGIGDTDNVIGGVDRSQRHVAEHIVNDHNAVVDKLAKELSDQRDYVNMCADNGERCRIG